MKTRVFISCGQNKQNDEVDIAGKVAEVLAKLGFDPYIAVTERTLRGVKENIFQRLAESEYFLFIDFKRECLPDGSYRGSLFSHQELAIAAFSDKEVLPFQEKGVRPEDGIMKFIQANAVEFAEREALPELVRQHASRHWKADWANELTITRRKEQFSSGYHHNPSAPDVPWQTRYFHLDVTNHNRSKSAINCCAYLVKVCVGHPDREVKINEVEFKWRGVVFPYVIVPPGKSRELDAFYIRMNEPGVLISGALTDSPDHQPVFNKPGEYWLTFAVHSQNFREAKQTFRLTFDGQSADSIVFEQVDERGG